MANTKAYIAQFGESDAKDKTNVLPPRINVRETLRKYHFINFEKENREVFWVAFSRGKKDRTTRVSQLRGRITLNNGTLDRVGVVHYIARRPALRMTAVVVVDF